MAIGNGTLTPIHPEGASVATVAMHAELARLREENAGLRSREGELVGYLRSKIDQLLDVIGTLPLRAEELDDTELIAFDPISIVAEAFSQVLENQRRTNEQLVHARDEITAIFNSVGAGIMVLDREQKILAYNQRLKELFFPTARRALGRSCVSTLCQSSTAPESCVYFKVLRSGQVETSHDWAFSDRYFDVIGAPIKDKKGTVTQTIIVYTDVTERKLAQEGLLEALDQAFEARELTEAVLRSVSEGLLVTDEAGCVLLANPAAEALLTTKDGGIFGRSLAELFPETPLARRMADALQSGIPGEAFDLLPPGVMARSHQARLALLRANDDVVRGGIVTLHDVSRERAIERMKSEFVSTAAHELRTPLTAILGFSELLLDADNFSVAERQDFAGLIHHKAEDLAAVIDELLDITRIESGRAIELTSEAVRLDELALASIDFFRRSCPHHRFEVNAPAQPILVDVDPRRIGQVFDNLLSNAVKYSPAGGLISITLVPQQHLCAVSIHDQGIGMTPEQLNCVFDKFYRADASNTAVPGTGLGMTIVRQLVEGHGGTITVESALGQGTTVRFTLPLWDGKAQEPATP